MRHLLAALNDIACLVLLGLILALAVPCFALGAFAARLRGEA